MLEFAGRPTETDVDPERVLRVLADAECRAMLDAASEPRTTGEFVDACDVSASTAYRKLDRLTDAGLLEERTRIDGDGHHAAEYCRTADAITVTANADGGFEVAVDRTDDPAAAAGRSFAPADD